MDNATIRYSAYDFLFDFNRNYVPVFYRFRDIAGYLSDRQTDGRTDGHTDGHRAMAITADA